MLEIKYLATTEAKINRPAASIYRYIYQIMQKCKKMYSLARQYNNTLYKCLALRWDTVYWLALFTRYILLYDVPVGFVTPPPPILRLNIAYFAVAEGWLLLDIG